MKNVLTSIILLAVFSVIIFFVGGIFKLYGTFEGPGEILGDKVPEYVIRPLSRSTVALWGILTFIPLNLKILFGTLGNCSAPSLNAKCAVFK